MNIRTYLLISTLALSLCSVRAQKLAGGDISMLPRYEQAGATYYTHDGQSISDLILQQAGGHERHARAPLRQPKEADHEQQRTLHVEQ